MTPEAVTAPARALSDLAGHQPGESLGLGPLDARRALYGPASLRPWNDLAVLTAPDIHVASRLAGLLGPVEPDVLLGAAFAVRAVRLGHVCVDLATVADTATSDVEPGADLSDLPWPAAGPWLASLAASPLVASGDVDPDARPLRLVDTRLYLDRYWRQERQVAADLVARASRPLDDIDVTVLRDGLDRLFPPRPGEVRVEGKGAGGADRTAPARDAGDAEDVDLQRLTGTTAEATEAAVAGDVEEVDLQRLAAAAAVAGRLTVIAGGPGTGKTTTVARILALLDEEAAAAGRRPPRVALAAPTGKAAARLAEAVHGEAAGLDTDRAIRDRLANVEASTLHRLLGWRPDSASRFRHDRTNRLPHDAVVVDETSMLSLSLMAKLVDAVRPDARLVLVGDPQQLASVEAGAVLGDVVGPAATGMRMTPSARARLEDLTGATVPAATVPAAEVPATEVPAAEVPATDVAAVDAAAGGSIGDGIVVLQRVHRFEGGIADLAVAVAHGDADRAVALLRSDRADLRWLDGNASGVRDDVVRTGAALVEAARAGRSEDAVAALASLRVLCAHRQGPAGVGVWNDRIERWLAGAVPGYGAGGPWYTGRPLLVTENDYELQLYNGDTGVVVAGPDGRPVAVFERRGSMRSIAPARLGAVQTLHAMTVHKSQGSQFDEVIVVLPDIDGPIVTRELLYTAITRARRCVTVVGPEGVLRAAVARPIARASGLRQRLWGG